MNDNNNNNNNKKKKKNNKNNNKNNNNIIIMIKIMIMKGDTRRGERKNFSLSPPRVAFSRVG